jgi:hypothetical protein
MHKLNISFFTFQTLVLNKKTTFFSKKLLKNEMIFEMILYKQTISAQKVIRPPPFSTPASPK